MKVVIEVEETPADLGGVSPVEILRRMEQDRQEVHGWMELETPLYLLNVKVVGVVGRPESTGWIITPLEEM